MQSKTSSILAAASCWFTTFASPTDAPALAAPGERSIGLIKPQPQLAVKDSNMANFGTKLEYDIKEQAAKTEKAWSVVGKPGLFVWRINKFKVQPVEEPGLFYAGDSYVVLNTKAIIKDTKTILTHDVHFWLGGTTTQDEAGTAAYKAVELDDYLKREAVQHREVQAHESEMFLSYFAASGGMRVLEGGFETGFNIVKPESWRPRLLQIKGRKLLRVSEVPLARDSLNAGDVFIVDLGLTIFQWSGKDSSAKERGRGAQLTRAMGAERKGRAKVIVEEQGKESDEFWRAVGGKGAIRDAAAGGVDDSQETLGIRRLFKLSDASGKMTFSQLQEGQLDRNALDSNDSFIVDSGSEVFVWIGKKASEAERVQGPKYAAQYLSDFGRPAFIAITIVREGADNNFFELAFDKNSKARSLDFEPQQQQPQAGGDRSFNFDAAVPQERTFNF